MGGVKNRKGSSVHRYWYEARTDNKLTRIMIVDGGKKRMAWGVKESDSYRKVDKSKAVLK
jgi:hypothetical protein